MKQTLSPNLMSLCQLTDATAANDTDGLDGNDVDWNAVITLAQRHRVEGIIARRLGLFPNQVPAAVRQHFDSKLRRQALETLVVTNGLTEIHDAFSKRGIQYLLLKGFAISERFYKSRSERHSIDIDILVNEPDIKQALLTLKGLGFENHITEDMPSRCEQIIRQVRKDIRLFRPRDSLAVELHWRLTANPHLLPWRFNTAIANSEILGIAGVEHRVLKPAALLLYLTCHGTMHSWFRLKWLTDIQRIFLTISEMELREAIELTKKYDCQRIFNSSVCLAKTLYSGIPEIRSEVVDSHDAVSQMLDYMTRSLSKEGAAEAVAVRSLLDYAMRLRYELLFRTDARYRAKVLSRRLISYDDVARFRLSHRWYILYMVAGPMTQIAINIRKILPLTGLRNH